MTNYKKKQRRLERHQRNIQKEKEYKESAWKEGKLIEENHNNKPYSRVYTEEIGNRLHSIMIDIKSKLINQEDKSNYAIFRFRSYRKKIQDYILLYCPDLEKTKTYEYLKNLLECYWDYPENLWKIL